MAGHMVRWRLHLSISFSTKSGLVTRHWPGGCEPKRCVRLFWMAPKGRGPEVALPAGMRMAELGLQLPSWAICWPWKWKAHPVELQAESPGLWHRRGQDCLRWSTSQLSWIWERNKRSLFKPLLFWELLWLTAYSKLMFSPITALGLACGTWAQVEWCRGFKGNSAVVILILLELFSMLEHLPWRALRTDPPKKPQWVTSW